MGPTPEAPVLIAALSLSTLLLAATGDAADVRAAAWRQDLDTLRIELAARDLSFTPATRARFQSAVTRLRERVDVLDDDAIIVGMARAVALAGNAHTRVYMLRNRTRLRRYPVRVYWLGNSLYVVRARPDLRALLGARIEAIDGRPIDALRRLVAPLFAGNASWRDYMSTYLLTSPEILHGLGVVRDSGEARFTFRLPSGARIERRLEPSPLERVEQPTEAWWDLSPLHPGRFGPWEHALAADSTRLPRYLSRPRDYYWFERIPELNAIYFQFNRSTNAPGGEDLASYTERLLHELSDRPPRMLVIDLRFNTGGDLTLADSLFRGIASLQLARERGRLYVITGRSTFSAGITHVAEMRQWTRAIIVGERVGDGLDMWSEGGNFVLPNCGITIHYANGFHSYSRKPPRPGVVPVFDLSVDSLEPDLLAPLTAEAYFGGHDPAWDAIVRHAGR